MKLDQGPNWAGWQPFRARNIALAGAAMLAAGCAVVPKTAPPPVAPPPAPEPSATALPTDTGRHRIALLVPLSGDTAAVGQAIANATTMALLDTGADNLRITTYDTSTGIGSAAQKAIADGNKLILGPLTADAVPTVQAAARPAGVPVIAFANDASVASPDVFVIGHLPEQSIRRSVQYARSKGAARFAVLAPEGRNFTEKLALVELQNGAAAPSYVAGTPNFYAITRYNWSSYYALAVIDLGLAVREALGRPG